MKLSVHSRLQQPLSLITAEFIGTFFLVFFGCGAAAVESIHPGLIGNGGIAAAFGLIVMVQIYAVGNISGAHFNPAVTIGFLLAARLKGKELPLYFSSQLLGAAAAALLLVTVLPQASSIGVTLPAGSPWQALILEAIFTCLLMFIILNVSTGHMEKGIMAGVAVGGTVALLALIGGPLTGASMNPARSLGPALAAGNWSHHWVYWFGPILGSAAAAPWCRFIQREDCCRAGRVTDQPC